MTGDDSPDAADDRRDERVAALLEVPTLDEVTRHRLVSRALEAAAPRSRWRAPLAVAAAIVALLVVAGGVVTLVRRDHGPSTKTASRERVATSAPKRASGAAVPRSIGDLGDVSDESTLRAKATSALATPPPATAAESGRSQAGSQQSPACRLDTVLPAHGPVEALGSGKDGGRAVSVVVTAVNGTRTVFVLDATSCAVVRSVAL
jgi:hypothetical protein